MRGAVRAELLRLRRRAPAISMLLMVLFAALGTVVAFGTPEAAGEGLTQPGGAAVSVADLEAADGFAAGLHFVASLLGIVALSTWAVAVAEDFSSGLIRLLVQAVPRRWPLVVGKAAALLVWTLVGTLAATAVASLIAPAVAGGAGVSTAAWADAPVAAFLGSWLDLAMSTTAWGAIGMVLAMLTRSQAIAIGGGIAYLLVVENLVLMVTDTDLPYLPGQTLAAVAAGGTDAVGAGVGAVIAVALTVAAVLVSATRLRTIDIVQ